MQRSQPLSHSLRAAAAAVALGGALTALAACADDRPGPVAPAHPAGSAHAAVARPGHRGDIAFGSRGDGGPPEIWILPRGGDHAIQITDSPGTIINGQPDWSPDGRRIAFLSTRSGNHEIWVMDADGSNPVQLTDHPAADGAPVWSPNGRYIAFHSTRDGLDEAERSCVPSAGVCVAAELYLLELATGEVTRLTNHTGIDQFPDWSPNGKQIAFRRDHDIYVLDLRTGALTQLTSTPQVEDMPAWSPNGKQIAFMSARDGYPSIFVWNADGSDPVNLTPRPTSGITAPWQSLWPSWSRNGKEIYFQGVRPGTNNSAIMAVRVDGSGERILVDLPGIDSAPVAR